MVEGDRYYAAGESQVHVDRRALQHADNKEDKMEHQEKSDGFVRRQPALQPRVSQTDLSPFLDFAVRGRVVSCWSW